MDEKGDKAIDLDTGNIYEWNYEVNQYELAVPVVDPDIGNVDDVLVSNDPNDSFDEMDNQNLSSEVVLSDESLDEIVSLLSAYEPDGDTNLGTTNKGIFEGLAYKVPFGQHYVYWRDSQYAYNFAFGDISFENGVFYGNDTITICSYETTSSGYNTRYIWDSWSDPNFTLSVGDSLVYSDLGNFPDLINRREVQYIAIVSYSVIAIIIWSLFSNLRKAAFGR